MWENIDNFVASYCFVNAESAGTYFPILMCQYIIHCFVDLMGLC